MVTSLDLIPTWRCQLACPYCFNRGKGATGDMPVEVQEAAVRFLLDHRDVRRNELGLTWYGGEPSLAAEIIEHTNIYLRDAMARRGLSLPVRNIMPSNFISLSDRFKEVAKRWDMRMQCSCDGPCGQMIQRPKPNGESSYGEVMENARWYAEWRSGRVGIRMTITPATAASLAADVRALWERGTSRITYIPAFEIPWTVDQFETLWRQTEEVGDLILESFAMGRPLLTKWLRDPFRRWNGEWRKPSSHCGAARSMLAVDTSGNFWPCHRWAGNDPADPKWAPFFFGNVLAGDLDENKWRAWEDVDLVADIKADCENCPCYPWCGVGCVHMNFSGTGDMFSPPPLWCEFNRRSLSLAMRINYRLRQEKNAGWTRAWQREIRPRRSRVGRDYRCAHRGEQIEERACASCSGTVQIKIFACAKFTKCAIASRRLDGVASCPSCGERNAEPTPDPQPTAALDRTAPA